MLSVCKSGLVASLVLMLGACGGGGGGGGGGNPAPSGPAPTYTLSGTIALPETAAVDSDTNDGLQSGRVRNNNFASAQAITTPIQLVGTVNVPGAGPVGVNFAAGDADDYFKTPLTQGQVIEMSFVGGTGADDVDVYLVEDGTGLLVGSATSASASKCIQIGRTSVYYIRLQATQGAALYNLRISAPGDASCSITSTSTDPIIADELVVKASARATSTSRAAALQAAGLQSVDGETRGRPHLLRLPQDEDQRATGLARLEHWHRAGAAPRARNTSGDFPGRFRRARRAMETLEYAKRLMATGLYEYVEPNFRVEMLATYAPTEPLYVAQRWSYQQINQPSAMDRILGLALPPSTQRPIVAVIDSGIVNDHPDLQAQISGGYTFVSSSSGALGDGDTPDPNDPSTGADAPNWHGTHVAGTVAAIDNNGKFGAGVAPQALLMPLRVFAPGKSASSFDIVQAIRYAARLSNRSGTLPARAADVINMSIGSSGACPAQFSTEIANARAQNVVVVAAAGNGAHNDLGTAAAVSSPANCPGVIAVGALDARQQQTFYSNSGPTLRLMAPGGDAYQSTTGTGYSDAIYSTLGSFDVSGRTPSFGPLMGTSMASPHVAGVIALMRYVNPAISPTDIDTLIANGQITDDLGALGRDDTTGYGLIDARKAVDEAIALASSGVPPLGIVVASPASISLGSLSSSATMELKLTAPGTETVSSVVSNSAAVTVTPASIDAITRLGMYTISVDRSLLPLGTSFPTLTITTSTRGFNVQLTVIKAATAGSSTASYGRMVVQVSNATTGAALGQVIVSVTNGKYIWSIAGIPAGQVRLIAGTDLNHDFFFCDFGEVCGVYPDTADSIAVTGSMNGLNFAVAPTGTTASDLAMSEVNKQPPKQQPKIRVIAGNAP
ncbi:MAG: hypothetical protein JWL63_1197 [Rhodocyclales bacterium]|nr:hypothetical protein [Rhodocyclales bacterium]